MGAWTFLRSWGSEVFLRRVPGYSPSPARRVAGLFIHRWPPLQQPCRVCRDSVRLTAGWAGASVNWLAWGLQSVANRAKFQTQICLTPSLNVISSDLLPQDWVPRDSSIEITHGEEVSVQPEAVVLVWISFLPVSPAFSFQFVQGLCSVGFVCPLQH